MLFKLLRVKHWVKNILIFFPLFFSLSTDKISIISTIIGFFAFSFMASSIYIINDIFDVENDRAHEVKKNRPIASGRVSLKVAIFIAILLFIVSLILTYSAAVYGKVSVLNPLGTIIFYFILNILYTTILKHIPIIDILILALGFLIRIFFGAELIEVGVSHWLYLTILSAAFYMGLGKRRNELANYDAVESIKGDSIVKKDVRKVLKFYNYQFLDKNMYLMLAIAIVFYSLWTIDPVVVEKFGTSALVWTVPFIIVIAMKYNLNVEVGKSADPTDVILSDKVLICLLALYALMVFLIIYLKPIMKVI